MGAERSGLRLIQFTREPVPGQVKTRMLPALQPEAASDLHRELTLWTLRELCQYGHRPVELSVAGDPHHVFFDSCRQIGDVTVTTQVEGDLGERMHAALLAGLAASRKVILVGSDCPGIDGEYLRGAELALDSDEVVLGPALDGGYVLIGVRSVQRAWFEGIAWGGNTVYRDTTARLQGTGTRFSALAPLADIDRPEDLELWRSIKGGENASGARARGLRR